MLPSIKELNPLAKADALVYKDLKDFAHSWKDEFSTVLMFGAPLKDQVSYGL
jgi:hypothetical protein